MFANLSFVFLLCLPLPGDLEISILSPPPPFFFKDGTVSFYATTDRPGLDVSLQATRRLCWPRRFTTGQVGARPKKKISPLFTIKNTNSIPNSIGFTTVFTMAELPTKVKRSY
jgi:hypothetical protein